MRKKPEILAPAGSIEGVRAAVQNGADAIYMGFGQFNARRNAKNFEKDEIEKAIAYCRARNVKTHITVNTLPTDREYDRLLQDVETVYQAGADALIVQDSGLVQVLHQSFPDIDLHGSTQMTIHTLDGALQAKEWGMSRVVLSRELSLENIRYITQNCGIETEIFLHGALCMCYSGQCYFSAVIGQRSGNRGLCAQPCRLPYRLSDEKKASYPLSLKDLSLLSHMQELINSGVASLKIEGRMKRPEYTALVTRIYRDVLWEERQPTREEKETLQKIFSRDGFTDGYFTGKTGQAMFGIKTQVPLSEVQELYKQTALSFAPEKEQKKLPLKMQLEVHRHKPISLKLQEESYETKVLGDYPEEALHRAVTKEDLQKNLEKLGGTVWKNVGMEIILEDGLSIRASQINQLRREAVKRLMNLKEKPPIRRQLPVSPIAIAKNNPFRGYTVQVRSLKQVTASMHHMMPVCLYFPLECLETEMDLLEPLLVANMPLCPVLPRIYTDAEQGKIEALLKQASEIGISHVLVGNLGQVRLVKKMGFAIYGDFGLNVFNSRGLQAMADLGIERQTVSFELRLAQIRDMQKNIPTELLIYGYLPLMIFENCVISGKGNCSCQKEYKYLVDRKGKEFSLMPAFGCRNELLNSQPVYFGSKYRDYQEIGVEYGRIYFTKESPKQCEIIYRAILKNQRINISEGATQALYYRGVE
jgi:putative protease